MTIPVGYFQATAFFQHDDDPDPYNVVTLHEYDLTTFTETDHCNQIKEIWSATFLPLMSLVMRLTKVVGRFGQDGGPPLIFESNTIDAGGSTASDKLPQNSALLISKRTNLGGRRGRGRMFVPGVLGEAAVGETGVITSGVVADLQDKADDFLDQCTTGGLAALPVPLYLEHFPSTVSPGSEPPPTLVTSLVVDSLISTQRGRLRR